MILCLQLFFAWPIQAQDILQFSPLMFQYTTDNGLPSDQVYDVFQDSQGFIWLATENGVARYDGTDFESFHTADGLSGEEILSIREDKQGRIWMMTFSGIPSYWKDGRFHNPENTPFLKDIFSGSFLAGFLADGNGNVSLGYYDGMIFRVDRNNQVEEFKACSGLGCGINMIGETNEGKIVSTISCHHLWIWDNGKISYPKTSDMGLVGAENYPPKAILRQNGTLIYTWGKSAFVLDKEFQHRVDIEKVPGINAGKIIFLTEDREGRLWVGTTQGAYRYGTEGLFAEPEIQLMPGVHVSSILEDSDGGIWLATKTGIFHIPDLDIQFSQLSDAPLVTAIYLGDQTLLACSQNAQVLELEVQKGNMTTTATPAISVNVPMRRIFRLPSGDINLAGDQGIFAYQKGQLIRRQIIGMKDFAIHPDGKLACACMYSGWQEVEVDSIEVVSFGSKRIAQRKLAHPVRCISSQYDQSGRLWVVTSKGTEVYRDDRECTPQSLSEFFRAGFVSALLPDEQGGMWVGIEKLGLLHCDRDSGYQWIPGMESNQNAGPYGLFPAQNGNVWAASRDGLFLVSGDSSYMRLPASSLPSGKIVGAIDHGSYIWAVTTSGLCRVPKTGLAENQKSPRPFLRNFSVSDRDTSISPSLRLPYRSNTLQFTFRGLSFQENRSIEYRYRLVGMEDEWQTTHGEAIRYSSVPAGEYEFELQARHESGPWSESLTLPPITIVAPFWQTWWFPTILMLAAMALLGLIFYLILRGMRRRNQLLMSSMQSEHQALIVQMNPHFIFNALNSIQNYFLNDDKETANDFLADFSSLMRSTLENSRSTEISLADELKQLALYLRLEAMRLEDRFSYRFEVDPKVDATALSIPSMLLQPILENAVWHGLANKSGPGAVVLKIDREGDSLRIVVEDDGVGREKARELRHRRKTHKPLATEIMKERIEILNKINARKIQYTIEDLFDEEGTANGTRVSLTIPIQNQKKQ